MTYSCMPLQKVIWKMSGNLRLSQFMLVTCQNIKDEWGAVYHKKSHIFIPQEKLWREVDNICILKFYTWWVEKEKRTDSKGKSRPVDYKEQEQL